MSIVSPLAAAPIELLSAPTLPSNGPETAGAGAQAEMRLSEQYGKLPLMFEAIEGGSDEFRCRGAGYGLFLSPTQAVVSLTRARNRAHTVEGGAPGSRGALLDFSTSVPDLRPAPSLRIMLAGANWAARADALDPLPTTVNYFLGNDPGQWRTGVPTFGRVRYRSVYPGIDLVYYGNQGQLEYDFLLAGGADLSRIELSIRGADRVEVDAAGNLVLHLAGAQVRQRKPLVYQVIDGKRREIEGRYAVRPDSTGASRDAASRIGFEVGAYDATQALVIDPVLVYSTFLGGLDLDRAWDIAVGSNGCAYVAGDTVSTNFPAADAFASTNHGGLADVFLAKLGPDGTNLIYATYLGGNGADQAFGMALDAGDNIYLTGLTASTNFPLTANAVSTQLHSAVFFGYYTNDAFAVKLAAADGALLYSTFLGGSGPDEGIAIAVDGAGAIYVAGDTFSPDFPTNTASSPFAGARDAFVVKLDPNSTNVAYSTFLGGSGDDRAQGLAVDAQGNAVVAGFTTSADFPVTNAFQTNFGGGVFDAFVTKLSPDGATRLFSTYLGGIGNDEALRLALDNAGNVFIAGITSSTNFPTQNPAQSENGGGEDAFVTKLDATGTNLIYSTYLGGVANDEAWSIAVDTHGDAYVAGLTASTNFPTAHAYQFALAGLNDAFVLRLNPAGSTLDYSTYLGGLDTDNGIGIALDGAGNAYVAGYTFSLDFPVYPMTNGVQVFYGGGSGDAFVAKLTPRNAELRAQVSGANAVSILWPVGLPNFQLQSTDDLGGTNTPWLAVTNVPSVVGDDYSVAFTNTTGHMFFRLMRE